MATFTLWMPNGRGHLPCASPALKLKNIVIACNRVWYQVVVDSKKHAMLPLNGKNAQIVALGDVSGLMRTRCRHTG